MALKVPVEALIPNLSLWVTALSANLRVALFMNDYVPADASVFNNFTPATFDGYFAGLLSNWTTPVMNVDGVHAESQADPIVWTNTGNSNLPQTIFGYFVYDYTTDIVWWAERFSNPISLVTFPTDITLIPKYMRRSEY